MLVGWLLQSKSWRSIGASAFILYIFSGESHRQASDKRTVSGGREVPGPGMGGPLLPKQKASAGGEGSAFKEKIQVLLYQFFIAVHVRNLTLSF